MSKNFAISAVAVAPSPPTTGLSLTVAAGEGARFPAVPFKLTLWPSTAVFPTPVNAEVATVTNVTGDVLTLVRGSEGSTPQPVAVGYEVMASITAAMWDAVAASGVVNAGLLGQVAYYAANGTVVSGSPVAILSGTGLTVNGSIGITQNLTVTQQANFGNTSNDYGGTGLLFLKGITKGLRFGTNAIGSYVEAVDNTGTASFQPLQIGGSTQTFQINGATVAAMDATSFNVVGFIRAQDAAGTKKLSIITTGGVCYFGTQTNDDIVIIRNGGQVGLISANGLDAIRIGVGSPQTGQFTTVVGTVSVGATGGPTIFPTGIVVNGAGSASPGYIYDSGTNGLNFRFGPSSSYNYVTFLPGLVTFYEDVLVNGPLTADTLTSNFSLSVKNTTMTHAATIRGMSGSAAEQKYGILSFNDNYNFNGMIGLLGGGSIDLGFYLSVPLGGYIQHIVNGVNVGMFNSAGLSVIGNVAISNPSANVTVSIGDFNGSAARDNTLRIDTAGAGNFARLQFCVGGTPGSEVRLSTAGAVLEFVASGTLAGSFSAAGLTIPGYVAIGTGFGIVKSGTGLAGFAEWSNSAMFGTTGYAMLQSSSGQTILNAASGQSLALRVANADILTVTAGNVAVTGAITATGNITAFFSDDRLKTRLGRIEHALDKVCLLEGFFYEPNQTAQDLGYDCIRNVGVSAQLMQEILPEIVAPAPIDSKYLTIRYEMAVPLLIEAIKELRAQLGEIMPTVR